MTMVLVYHATRASALPDIKRDGLQPTGTARKSNFGGDHTSRPEFVYLSRYKAGNYALAATGLPRERVALLEIVMDDLERARCFPDEDAIVFDKMIAEGTFEGPSHNRRFDELIKDSNPLECGDDFERLFERFGLVAYRGAVPFTTVRRYLVGPSYAVVNFTKVLKQFQPVQDDVVDHQRFGSDTVRFLFDGGDIEGVSRGAIHKLRTLRKSFNVYRGPRLT